MSSARQQAAVLAELLRHERDALAEFLSALADFDRRRAWADLGHDSLFAFLVKDLGLSNGAAAYRRAAVELVQRFPQVLEHLRTGELCITTVFELSKVVTDENASEVIPRFFGASKRDAQDVVAELAPEPAPQRTVVTLVQAPAVAPADRSTSSGRLADHAHANFDLPAQEGRASGAVAPASSRTVVEPRTAELSRVHVTVSRQLLEKLAAAKDALSHSHPNASDADVIEVGLELVIRRHWKRRGSRASRLRRRPRPPRRPPRGPATSPPRSGVPCGSATRAAARGRSRAAASAARPTGSSSTTSTGSRSGERRASSAAGSSAARTSSSTPAGFTGTESWIATRGTPEPAAARSRSLPTPRRRPSVPSRRPRRASSGRSRRGRSR